MFDLVEHPRDESGRFIVSGSRRDTRLRLRRLEQRLAAVERLLRAWRRNRRSSARLPAPPDHRG